MEEKEIEKLLIIVDMQNDFIDGSLGSQQAKLIVPKVVEKIKNHSGSIFYTSDIHFDDYLDTREGKTLPVKHCILGTEGCNINADVENARPISPMDIFGKSSFGSVDLVNRITKLTQEDIDIESIELVGLCTGICVISNAILLRTSFPNTKIIVDSNCCACVTEESHKIALDAMRMCQIEVI